MKSFLRAVSMIAFVCLATRVTSATIRYSVSIQERDEHTFQVVMTIPNPAPGMVVALPAWNALYQIRDFGYRVTDLEEEGIDKGQRDEESCVRKLDKQTWQIGGEGTPKPCIMGSNVRIRYSIQWNDPGPFGSQLNSHHAFINLADILMYIPNRREESSEVVFLGKPADWRIIQELPSGPEADSFLAESYDKLVDAPVEIGSFEEFEFDNGGAHFRVVVDGEGWSKGRLESALRRITSYELKLMGGPPFKEYTFIFHLGPYLENGGGGMEHANSTAIAAGSLDGAVSIAAHEFFHVWNVKRIRPQALEPVDYSKEQYTRALWFAEGVTSTYAAFTLERSGLWSKDQFYSDLAQQIGDLEARPAHTWQSVEESSLDAWYEKYDTYNRPDRSISYYNKGQILGVLLDLQIRNATDNRKSLDDALRTLNQEYALQGKFYNESEGVRRVVEEVVGISFADFFQNYVAGTLAVPYGDFLAAAGLELKQEAHRRADLGFWPGFAPGTGMQVTAVEAGGRAEVAGLRAGDLLLALNGEEVMKDPYRVFRSLFPGQIVKLHVRRGLEEMDISYQLGSREDRLYTITEMPNPSEKQRRIREGVIHGATD